MNGAHRPSLARLSRSTPDDEQAEPASDAAAPTLPVGRGKGPRSERRARRRRLLAGLALFAVLATLCLSAPWLTDTDPLATDAGALALAPGAPGHLFGTDALGRDLLARVLYGGRVSLTVGVLAAGLSLTLGIGVGVLTGGGPAWLDALLMRLVDALLALPLLVALIAVQAVAPAGVLTVVLVIGALGWMPVARVVRAQFLTLRRQPFVEAAEAVGATPSRVALRHILPNALRPVLAVSSFEVAGAILTETALSFLGLGVPASTPTWGNILTQAQNYLLLGQWWTLCFPALGIGLAVLSVNLVAGAIQE